MLNGAATDTNGNKFKGRNDMLASQIRLTRQQPVGLFSGGRNWSWTVTIPDYYNLWYAQRGAGEIRVNGRKYPIRGGHGFVLAPGDQVQASTFPEQPLVNFAAHWSPRSEMSHPFPLYDFRMTDPLLFNILVERCMHRHYADDAAGRKLREHFVAMMLAMIIRDHRTSTRKPWDAPIMNLIDRIRESPQEEWSVNRMCQLVGLSKNQLNLRFKQAAGVSPNVFLIQTRIGNACELLAYSDLTVEAVADSIGYRDIYFFSRQFKKRMGVSPSVYRDRQGSTRMISA